MKGKVIDMSRATDMCIARLSLDIEYIQLDLRDALRTTKIYEAEIERLNSLLSLRDQFEQMHQEMMQDRIFAKQQGFE